MSSDDPRFNCPNCGKSYKWKAEMAGRSAKCGCGAKLVVPAERPAAAPARPAAAPPPKIVPAATDEMPLAPESSPSSSNGAPAQKSQGTTTPAALRAGAGAAAAATGAGTNCPICKSAVAAGAVLCVKCGYNFKTGKRLAAVVVETDVEEADDEDEAAPPDKGGAGA